MRVCAWFMLGLVLTAAGRSEAGEAQKMAVMAIRVDTGLPKGMDRTLNDILLGEVHRHGGFDVLGASDIAAMLQHEQQKMLLGCDEAACVAELGGALGVSLVVVPSIGAVGDRFVINLNAMDATEAKVLARVNQTVDRDENAIIAGLKTAVAQLLASLTGRPAPPPPDDGLGFLDVAPWVTLGLTVAAAGTGGAFGGLAMADEDAAGAELRGTDAWRNAHGAAQDKALVADVMFGLAGAAAVTTLILFLVDSDDSPAVGFGPTDAGAGLGLRF